MRTLRLLPVVIMTSFTLLAMKTYDLARDDGQGWTGVSVAQAQSEAQAQSDAVNGAGADDAVQTGQDDVMDDDAATAEMADANAEATITDAGDAAPGQPGEVVQDTVLRLPQQTSREILLERLGDRRLELEQREQDIFVREQLLEAAEQRLEERLAELSDLENRLTTIADVEEQRESEEIGRLVQVYSAMRAKDAAAIFNLLDLPILMEVAGAMTPRKMADILGEMDPDAARRLTIALAGTPTISQTVLSETQSELPQIEGVPIQ